MRRVCGGSSRQRSQQRAGQGLARRSRRARRSGQACSWWPSPQAGWRRQGSAAHPCPASGKVVRFVLVQLSRLLEGVRGLTLKGAELHQVGGNVQETRFSICDQDEWGRRCEREAEVVPVRCGRPGVPAQIGQTPNHGLGSGRAFESMPHLLCGEPTHLADSAPAGEPTRRRPRGAWPDRGSPCLGKAFGRPDGGEDVFFH